MLNELFSANAIFVPLTSECKAIESREQTRGVREVRGRLGPDHKSARFLFTFIEEVLGICSAITTRNYMISMGHKLSMQ